MGCVESANSKVSATIRIPAFSGGGNQPPGPGIRTYDRDVKPIMSANCAKGGCHVGGSSGKNADLTTYTNVKTRIVSILSMVTSGYMPPGAPLRASDIQTINDWNAAGLLESDVRGSLKLAADSKIGRLIWEFSIANGTGSSAWNSFSMPAELFVGEVLRIRALEGRHGFHTQSKPCPHGGNRQYDANGNQLVFNAVAEIRVNGYIECDIASTIDTTVGGLPQVYDHIQGTKGLFFLKAVTP